VCCGFSHQRSGGSDGSRLTAVTPMPASATRTASTAPSMAPRTSGVSWQPNSMDPATTPTRLMTGGETPWNSAWRIDSRRPGSWGLRATMGPRLRIPFLS
jgi:hypothetical protein